MAIALQDYPLFLVALLYPLLELFTSFQQLPTIQDMDVFFCDILLIGHCYDLCCSVPWTADLCEVVYRSFGSCKSLSSICVGL